MSWDTLTTANQSKYLGFVTYVKSDTSLRARIARAISLGVASLYLVGALVWAVAQLVAGRSPYLFVPGIVFLAQLLVITIRSKALGGPVLSDPVAESRISPILLELCQSMNCEVPRVAIRRSRTSAGIVGQRNQPTLLVSPDLLSALNDKELRAVLAHEVAHVSNGDLGGFKRQSFIILLGAYAIGVVAGSIGGTAAFLLWSLYLVPGMLLCQRLMEFRHRPREIRADIEAVTETGDPESMARALEISYILSESSRNRILGGPRSRWIFFPWSLRPRTHPSLAQRVERIRSIGSSTHVN